MTDETGAAAPADGTAAANAATESEKATQPQDVGQPQPDAAAENAEDQAKPEDQGEADTEQDDQEEKPRKLTHNQRLQRVKARLATQVAEQAAEIDELRRKVSAGAPDKDLPKSSDYAQGEYDPGYLSDLAAHKAAAKFGEALAVRDNKAAADRAAAMRDEAVAEFLERAEEAKGRVPDFDKVINDFTGAGGKFSKTLADELQDSEHGPLIAYQLAKNPARAAQLNEMSEREVAKEIGRMEAKIVMPAAKKQSQAPAPLRTPTGGASPPRDVNALANSDNLDAYVKMREEQERNKRKR